MDVNRAARRKLFTDLLDPSLKRRLPTMITIAATAVVRGCDVYNAQAAGNRGRQALEAIGLETESHMAQDLDLLTTAQHQKLPLIKDRCNTVNPAMVDRSIHRDPDTATAAARRCCICTTECSGELPIFPIFGSAVHLTIELTCSQRFRTEDGLFVLTLASSCALLGPSHGGQ
eukprot:COSAG06_NODE_2562_length_6663_cov_2.216941_2_plen_173_part_00